MVRKLASVLMLAALVSIQLGSQERAIASTVAKKQVDCGFIRTKNSGRLLRDLCLLEYGSSGVAGPGFARLHWSDGVQTKIEFRRSGITVDGVRASEHFPRRCGVTILDIRGNQLFWDNPFSGACH